MDLPVTPPVEPMLARLTRSFPEGELLYEPKWDGFRCIVFRDGDDIELQSRSRKSLTRYFPELLDPLRARLPARIVLDGELIVPRNGRLDFDALSDRIHPAESRVETLSRATPARFVAFDLLALDDESLLASPAGDRREALVGALAPARAPLHVTPATTDADVGRDWFARFEGAGLDGVIAKPLAEAYAPGERTLHKVKHDRTADVVVGGYRMHKDGRGVGSLLLGLYDADGRLHNIGVASSFRADFRSELRTQLAPFEEDVADHPWLADGGDADTTPRGENRWNARRDTSWTPVRIALVAEVGYGQLQGDRLRHPARFKRWRPDREPSSCTYDQLDVPAPIELTEVLG